MAWKRNCRPWTEPSYGRQPRFADSSLLLFAVRIRLLFRALSRNAVLDFVVCGLRDHFLLQQIFFCCKWPGIDDRLRVIGPHSGQRSEVFLARAIQIDHLSFACCGLLLLGRTHLVSRRRIRTLVAGWRSGLLILLRVRDSSEQKSKQKRCTCIHSVVTSSRLDAHSFAGDRKSTRLNSSHLG